MNLNLRNSELTVEANDSAVVGSRRDAPEQPRARSDEVLTVQVAQPAPPAALLLPLRDPREPAAVEALCFLT